MATSIDSRLQELGIVLPSPPAPGGNYVSAKTVGSVVYLSGVISTSSDGVITGTVGLDRTIDEGYAAARACALMQLAVLKRHLGSLDAVKSVVDCQRLRERGGRISGLSKVINGASDFSSKCSAMPAVTSARRSASLLCRAMRWSSCN